MIKNKLITISKDNQFDKGWTLFRRHNFDVRKNRLFRKKTISDILRAITASDVINLILCEPCLSSRIVEEIKWANKYIKLNIIAKDESIIDRYAEFAFSSKVIDRSVDLNYIGIKVFDRSFEHFIISEGFIEVDDSLDMYYFNKENITSEYSFLDNVKEIIIIDGKAKKCYPDLIAEVFRRKIQCNYIVNTRFFDRNIFCYAKNGGFDLFVSDFTEDSVILVNKDDTLFCLSGSKGCFFLTYPKESINKFLGQEYKSCFYDDVIDLSKIQVELYSCFNGKISKFDIVEKKIVTINVPVKLMTDFVEERFDFSVVDSHNDYSAEAKKVEYQFTLTPPLIDETYVESSIYDEIKKLKKEWGKIAKLDSNAIKSDYLNIIKEDFGILYFIEKAKEFTEKFKKMVDKCEYIGYYQMIVEATDTYRYCDENLIGICKKMFNAINNESADSKYDVFDKEIAGYRQTISEKEALVENGVDVISNNRRIEVLTKKINDLLQLKNNFINNANSRNEKNLSLFIEKCNAILSGEFIKTNDDSIGNIVKPKEETGLSKLETFIEKYLYKIKSYITDCLAVLNGLNKIRIPEDYKVYDKNTERYIVINDLSEFETTKSLCKEFSLKCVTRR